MIKINGGLPAPSLLGYQEFGTGQKRQIVIEVQPGLKIPGILVLPKGKVGGLWIVVSDGGKIDAQKLILPKDDTAMLYLDTLGIGELSGVEMRYSVYLGASIPFLDGYQITRAAEAMKRYTSNITVLGRGPIASQAVMYAGLLKSDFTLVMGQNCMRSWLDVFKDGVSDSAVQPRAPLSGSLEHLRSLVPHGQWDFQEYPIH